MKKMFWINAIHSSGLLDYIADKMQPVCIIFFGSSEKGEDIESSDIDLFVEAKEQEIDVQKFSRLLTREISIHFKEHFNDLSKELKNNILNGTKLYGYLKIF
jgi:predicted nucleotidyltransferase